MIWALVSDLPTSIQVAGWLACLVAVVAAANQVFRFWNNLGMGKKERREVYFGLEPASKAEFDKCQEHCGKRHENMLAKIDHVDRDLADELKKIRERLAAVERDAGFLNQRIVQMDMKLDRLIERK
jgi:hypothetical protein